MFPELSLESLFQEENLMSGSGSGPGSKKVQAESQKRNLSEWFSLFADLDPLSNPDAIGISTKESDPNCYS
jgi:Islet cell autoantigen ICA69, C-terminal domain